MNKARRSRIRNSLPLCGLDIYKYKEAAGGWVPQGGAKSGADYSPFLSS